MAETQQEETKQETSEQTEAKTAEFPETPDSETVSEETNLDILLDVTMPITVNIGKTEVPFRRLLQLGPGSVLQLDKTIGQPAELFVQDIKFATGEIVLIEGCFAVKMKDVFGMESQKQPTEEH